MHVLVQNGSLCYSVENLPYNWNTKEATSSDELTSVMLLLLHSGPLCSSSFSAESKLVFRSGPRWAEGLCLHIAEICYD